MVVFFLLFSRNVMSTGSISDDPIIMLSIEVLKNISNYNYCKHHGHW